MKRFLCILLCLLLAVPAAAAETYTPVKLFRQQFITGGYGIRGTATLTASGMAEWLDVLLPLTATTLQVRIIGEQQGAQSAMVTDDDDWQARVYTKNAAGEICGETWLYGNPEGLWFSSDLLPDVLLTLPAKNVHIPYQLTKGELLQLFSALDPLGLKNGYGNTNAYSAFTDMAMIDEETWAADWQPVLEKYYTDLDLWLSGYAAAPVISGSTGSMTMRTSYQIPAEDLKAQAKYILAMMLYDHELQNLLATCFTPEQRALYLNTSLIYFYDHCIDLVPLSGNIILEKEMTMMGETVAMTVSMPIPALPEELVGPIGKKAAELFSLPYSDLLSGLERISFKLTDGDLSISVMSPQRTISFIIDERADNAETVNWEGFIRVTPAVVSDDPPFAAAFAYKQTRKLYDDDDYNTHEDYTWKLSVEPDLTLVSEEDPFRSRYVDFAPLSFGLEMNFTKKDKANSPIQLALKMDAELPEAVLGLEASLRITERWVHADLPVSGGENIAELTDERKDELRREMATHAVQMVTALTTITEPEAEPTAEPTASPTAVPPMQ